MRGVYTMLSDHYDELKDIIANTFPEIKITNFSLLGSGKYAYTCLVNKEIVFKVPKSNDEKHTNDQIKEVKVLNHLQNKINFKIPKILYHKVAENGKYIIGETFMSDTIYSQELHDSFDENAKSNILQQIGIVMRKLHESEPDFSWLGKAPETYIDSLKTFDGLFCERIRKILPNDLVSQINTLIDTYKQVSISAPVKPVLCHCDLHFGNMMFDKKTRTITGLIDFGSAQYAEPARDMHYYYGSGAKDLLIGYRDNSDPYIDIRQKFHSTKNMLCNISDDLNYNKSPEKNIAKLYICSNIESER